MGGGFCWYALVKKSFNYKKFQHLKFAKTANIKTKISRRFPETKNEN